MVHMAIEVRMGNEGSTRAYFGNKNRLFVSTLIVYEIVAWT